MVEDGPWYGSIHTWRCYLSQQICTISVTISSSAVTWNRDGVIFLRRDDLSQQRCSLLLITTKLSGLLTRVAWFNWNIDTMTGQVEYLLNQRRLWTHVPGLITHKELNQPQMQAQTMMIGGFLELILINTLLITIQKTVLVIMEHLIHQLNADGVIAIGVVIELWCTNKLQLLFTCLLYTSPSPRDRQKSRMPSSA